MFLNKNVIVSKVVWILAACQQTAIVSTVSTFFFPSVIYSLFPHFISPTHCNGLNWQSVNPRLGCRETDPFPSRPSLTRFTRLLVFVSCQHFLVSLFPTKEEDIESITDIVHQQTAGIRAVH